MTYPEFNIKRVRSVILFFYIKVNDKDIMKSCYSKLGYQNSESNQLFEMQEKYFAFLKKKSYKFIVLESTRIKGNFDSKDKD